jgi:hypothetical protein
MLRKIIALIISQHLRALGEQRLMEYQCGFRPQRGCSDQLFSVRRLSELAVAKQRRLYLAFVDLCKAFDSVNRNALWAVLRASGLPEDLVSVLIDMHTGTSCHIRVGSSCSSAFRMEFGVQQGCPLAPFLFNIFMDWVVREALAACPDSGVSLQYGFPDRGTLVGPAAERAATGGSWLRLPLLMLADDIVVLASSAAGLEQFLLALEAACQRWGLVINPDKTELMLVGGAAATACEQCQQLQPEGSMLLCDACDAGWHLQCLDPPLLAAPAGDWLCPTCQLAATLGPGDNSAAAGSSGTGAGEEQAHSGSSNSNGCAAVVGAASSGSKWRPCITLGGRAVKWADKFKYLGGHCTATGELDTELSYRIGLAAAVFRRLQRPFFCQRVIQLSTRIVVFTVMVLSVLLYGCESWALTEQQLERLEVFHRGCLRQILGIRRRDHVSDAEVYRRCHEGGTVCGTIASHVRRRALRWLGHLGRMEDGRLAKQLLWGTLPVGAGRPGRRTNPLLPQVYHRHLCTLDLSQSRREFQKTASNKFGFSWLIACSDRDTWRELVG